MYENKPDLVLNNLQGLMCRKTKLDHYNCSDCIDCKSSEKIKSYHLVVYLIYPKYDFNFMFTSVKI